MSLADRLSQPDSFPAATPRSRHTHPAGWEPGIDTAEGVVTARTDDASGPDWSHVLTNLGLDPDDWQVIDDQAEVRSWDMPGTGRCYYHKAKVRPSRDSPDLDLEALAAEIRRRGPLRNATNPPPSPGGGFYSLVLTDWQAFKGTGGGIDQLHERLARLGGQVEQDVTMLRDMGIPVPNGALLFGGDMVENCDGHYAMQTYEAEGGMRKQVKYVRRTIVELLDRWAPLFDTIAVAAAAGNHGEKRKNGRQFTEWSDNYDLEVVEQAADMLAMKPDRYGHVRFRLPDPDSLCSTVDLDGVVVAVAHGHQCRKGGQSVQQKAMRWWGAMAESRHPVGDADVLVTGHFHHFEAFHNGTYDGRGRLWLQAPALDGGSPWFEQTGGGFTDAGTLRFVAADGRVDHIRIIPADG